MKIKVKELFFVLFGLLLLTVIFFLGKQNIAIAAKKNGKKFGDWTVSCIPKNKKLKTCLLTQQISFNKNSKKNKQVILLQIGYFGKSKELKILETVPLGVNIQSGTFIISSKKLISPGKYTICLSNGCNAIASISKESLKTLLSNKNNDIAFIDIEGQQITIPFSVKGLRKGLKYIK